MAMTERDDDPELEELLAEARALGPVPSEDLFRRILAEADAVAAERRRPAPAPAPRVAWREWLRALGGWPVVGGLAASTVAGLWIGAAAPAVLSDLLPSAWGEQVSVSFGVDEDPLSLLEG